MTTYLVGIVGEASYQPAIGRCREGQAAAIEREPDNPHSALALKVSAGGETIGYIGRDHWLQDVLHVPGKSGRATIYEITGAGRANRGIVLEVSIVAGNGAQVTQQRRGWLTRLLFGKAE